MRILIVFVIATMLHAQTNGGHVKIGGNVGLSTTSRAASLTMGLVDFNLNTSEGSNTIEAMQFVYSQFQQNSSITHPTADSCSVLYNGKMYLIGGYGTDANTPLNYVQIYNPVTDTWTQGAAITTAEWGAGCALYSGKIYTFGGVASNVQTPTTNAYVYDIAGNSWSTLTSLPSSVISGLMATTVGNFIYLRMDTTLWKFDPAGSGGSGSYTTLTSAPNNAEWALSGYVNISGDDRIYYIGGSNSGGTNTNAVYYWSVTNGTWSAAQSTAPFSARGMVKDAVYNGKFYSACGFDGTTFIDSVYSYDPSANSWSSVLAAMNSFRDGCSGDFYGNTLYVLGGRNAVASAFGMDVNESLAVGNTIVSQPFTTIQLNYTGAAGNVHLGVYSDSSGSPGSLLLDAGAVSVTSGWTVISGLNLSLTQGTRYWLSFLQSGTTNVSYTSGAPKNPNGAVIAHCFATQTYGALPGTFPASPNCLNNTMYAEKITVN